MALKDPLALRIYADVRLQLHVAVEALAAGVATVLLCFLQRQPHAIKARERNAKHTHLLQRNLPGRSRKGNRTINKSFYHRTNLLLGGHLFFVIFQTIRPVFQHGGPLYKALLAEGAVVGSLACVSETVIVEGPPRPEGFIAVFARVRSDVCRQKCGGSIQMRRTKRGTDG